MATKRKTKKPARSRGLSTGEMALLDTLVGADMQGHDTKVWTRPPFTRPTGFDPSKGPGLRSKNGAGPAEVSAAIKAVNHYIQEARLAKHDDDRFYAMVRVIQTFSVLEYIAPVADESVVRQIWTGKIRPLMMSFATRCRGDWRVHP